MGIFGTYGPPQSQDFQMHQQMRVPLFNEPLPAQQAAAAAQHPMLAPRPVDMPPNLGYQAMSSSETSPPESKSALPAPQFYYPTPPVNIPPQPWPSHTAEQDQPGFNPPKSTSHLQDQHQSQPQQNSPPVNIGDTDTHAAQGTERVEFKYPQQPVVGWETFPTSQDYAAQYAAQLASESAPNNKSQEHPLFPRVCLDISCSKIFPLIYMLKTRSTASFHISISPAVWTDDPGARYIRTLCSSSSRTGFLHGRGTRRLL